MSDFFRESFDKLEAAQTLAVFSAAAIGFGALLLFVTFGTKNKGVQIASTVFLVLGATLAISTLGVYADYWKNSRMIKQQPVHYVMGWGQYIYIAAAIFSIIAAILVGVSLSPRTRQGVCSASHVTY